MCATGVQSGTVRLRKRTRSGAGVAVHRDQGVTSKGRPSEATEVETCQAIDWKPSTGSRIDSNITVRRHLYILPAIVTLGILLRLAAYWVFQTPAGRKALRAPHEALLPFHPFPLDLSEETIEARTSLDLVPPQSPYSVGGLVTPPLLLVILVALSRHWPLPPVASPAQDACFVILLLADCASALLLAGALRRLRTSPSFSRPDLSTVVKRLVPELNPGNKGPESNPVATRGLSTDSKRPSESSANEIEMSCFDTSSATGTSAPTSEAYVIRVETLCSIASADVQIAAVLLLNPLTIMSTALLAQAPLKFPFLALAVAYSLAPDINSVWSSLAISCGGTAALAYFCPLPTVAPMAFLVGHLWSVASYSPRTGRPPRQIIDKPNTTELLLDSVAHGVLPYAAGSLGLFFLLLLLSACLAVVNRGWIFKSYWERCVLALLRGDNPLPDLGLLWFPIVVGLKGLRSSILVCFHGAGVLTVGPVYLRMFRMPFTAIQTMISVLLLLQPRVSVADISFVLAILIMDPYVLRECPELVIAVVALPCCTAAFSAFAIQWIQRNILNSNYLFVVGATLMAIIMLCLNSYFKTSMSVHAGADSKRTHETKIIGTTQ